MRAHAARASEAVVASLIPAILALVATGLLLVILGRDPIEFYSDMLNRGLLEWPGFRLFISPEDPERLCQAVVERRRGRSKGGPA